MFQTLLSGSMRVSHRTENRLVLRRRKGRGIFALIIIAVLSLLMIRSFQDGSLNQFVDNSPLTLFLVIQGSLTALGLYVIFLLIGKNEWVFDRSSGLLTQNGKEIAKLSEIKETLYKTVDFNNSSQKTTTRQYLLYLVLPYHRVLMCYTSDILEANAIAERLEEMFEIPMNLNLVEPQKYNDLF